MKDNLRTRDDKESHFDASRYEDLLFEGGLYSSLVTRCSSLFTNLLVIF